MQSHARVVVVGGGCVGVNILHELARRGWSDAVLLERSQLTAGSTWHAAGLIPVYSFSYRFGRLIAKSIEIYEGLEAETGHPVGWHKCGQLRVANSRERMDEYLNYASIAETQGVRAEILSPAEVRGLWPLFTGHRNLLGGVYNPDDGHIAPADVTQAAAAGARAKGAKIHQETRVTAFEPCPNGEWRVRTERGDIVCEHVVVATGSYARETGAMVGLDLPALPILHQYWVTETVPELVRRHAEGLPEMPVLRDETINGYVREEGEGLMFGPYERPEKLEHFALGRRAGVVRRRPPARGPGRGRGQLAGRGRARARARARRHPAQRPRPDLHHARQPAPRRPRPGLAQLLDGGRLLRPAS